jgi:hypothetical protein
LKCAGGDASYALKLRTAAQLRDNDYDVLENGVVVGRIFKVPAAAPEGRPWMWASGHGGHHIERAAHNYEATREAAMAAFARSWGRVRACTNSTTPRRELSKKDLGREKANPPFGG